MFPYPSGDLHMGHAEAFVMGDVVARYWRLRGYDVMHPIGWDSFGLPAENAAIARGTHPAEWTYANIETQATSFKRYGLSLDWSRRLHTSDPDYYRWTQWLFLRFRERGLAYRKASFVNWCPQDQTVLANEQVVAGLCERCGSPVTKRRLTQWYFKITEYAERLLDDMGSLEGGWPDRVLAMQRNWIGRSEGAYVDFAIDSPSTGSGSERRTVSVFTTRPDTLFGATFFVVAPEAPLATEIVTSERRAEFEAYLEKTKQTSEIERQSTEREKTGVFLGVHATNPVNGEQIPIYAADYVLAEYGTGAIMAVPAHDQRDLDFARAFGLPVREVVATGDEDPASSGIATPGDGRYVNSGPLDGLTDKGAGVAKIIGRLEADGKGRAAVTYRLRDWLLSRQRYWGCPIPIIHCERCGEVPVPDDQLPVELPYLKGTDLAPKGTSPLAAADEWVNVSCPECAGPARRDTDTMDTFVDSSWYFFRYCSPGYRGGPFNPADVERWMPVDQYVGGVEHAILHLLYMRFFTKVLYDMGIISFVEPMRRLLNQGQVINQGRSMSKSLGNGVDLGAQIDQFGVDAIRLTVVFAGPPEEDIDWADLSPAGSLRFLQRAYRLGVGGGRTGGRRSIPGRRHAASRDAPAAGRDPPVPGRPAVQRGRGPDHGAGQRRPAGHRHRSRGWRSGGAGGGRGGRRDLEPGVAVRRGGDVGPARPQPVGGERELAGRAGVPVGHRRGHLRGTGAGQGPGPAAGAAADLRGGTARAGPDRPIGRSGAERPGRVQGHRPGPQAGQHRPGLTTAQPGIQPVPASVTCKPR